MAYDFTNRYGRGVSDDAWSAVYDMIKGRKTSVTGYFVPVPLAREIITFSLSDIAEDWRYSADAVILWMRKHWKDEKFQKWMIVDGKKIYG